MKTLFILRHAKSSWGDANLADFDRPLNKRGLSAAAFVGNFCYENQIQPNLILSSPAKRAKQTAVLVKESAQFESKIQYEERIYEASPRTLMNVLSEADDKNETAIMIGHNPGLEGLIKTLTGEEVAMPTAGFVTISLSIESWKDITHNSGKLESLMRPREEMENLNID